MKRERIVNWFFWFLILASFVVVFRSWLSPKIIYSGDVSLTWITEKNLFFPFTWDPLKGSGLGGYAISTIWIDTYAQLLPNFFLSQGLSPVLIQKLIFFVPFLLLAFFSGLYLFRTVFPSVKKVRFLVPVIFGLNTYILMVVGGGQMGIGLAYALSPIVLGLSIKLIEYPSLRLIVLSGLILAWQVFLDPRIALLSFGAITLYFIFLQSIPSKKALKIFILPIIVAIGIHFYWLLPAILSRRSGLPLGLGEKGWVEFLSFAKFEDTISLLHPNWPENIFGKTYFMRPEFLLIPILAYLSLLFIDKSKRRDQRSLLPTNVGINSQKLSFFVFLGLVGAFLAKGANPPFENVYLWLFDHVPGMNMFRDSTKFYTWVIISYSVLIPLSVGHIYEWVKSKVSFLLPNLFLLFITSYLLFLIKPAILGQLGGTFQPKELPKEYLVLRNFLVSQPEFFRTFWVPRQQRFGYFSRNHPAIDGQLFFQVASTSAVVEKLEESKTRELFSLAGIKYLIIPYDSEGEIFLNDRKYDYKQRVQLEEEMDKISWLKKISLLDNISIYQTSDFHDHFWSESSDQGQTLVWKIINPTKYEVQITNASSPFHLIFSEAFDSLWQAKIGTEVMSSKPYKNLFNSFLIPNAGNSEVTIEYYPQKYLNLGLIISGLTLLSALVILFCL